MAISPYSMCPCGSGKQFKWCCQAYFDQIEKAATQIEKGQLTAADLTLKQLVKQHPNVPQVLGYQAELLYQQGNKAEAEEIARKALGLDPNFARGHWLLGSIMLEAEQTAEALKQFRQASELIHPNANEFLSQVLVRVAELEMEFVRPVASRVALIRATQVSPASHEIRQALDASFSPSSQLPEASRREYSFREPTGDKSVRWHTALEAVAGGKLSIALKAFSDIGIAHPLEADAQFNLGLIRAWVGENAKAIESLQKSIDLDNDETRIAECVCLIEVLRCGDGLEDQSDYIEHTAVLPVLDIKKVGTALGTWEESGRLKLQPPEKDSKALTGLLLEKVPDLGTAVDAQFAKVQAHVILSSQIVAFTSHEKDNVERTIAEFRELAPDGLSDAVFSAATTRIGENISKLARIPTRPGVSPERVTEELRNSIRSYYDDVWSRTPLKALNGTSPVDALANPGLKKRLPGLLNFIEDCLGNATANYAAEHSAPMYNFDRLRRKFGIAVSASSDSSALDIESMSPSELAEIKLDALTDQQLGDAFRASLRQNSPEQVVRFAQSAATRESIEDRYPFFSQLISIAKDEGRTDDVLRFIEEGTQADQATNASRRFGEYALARGRALARSGDVDGSASAFRNAIEKDPENLNLYSPAAEAMLGRKNGPFALAFAEQGLKVAQKQNNRDAQQQFQELEAAAKKLLG